MSIIKRSMMDEGAKFERQLAKLFKRLGYSVHIVGGTNDHGADLILTKRRKKIAVQAKCYSKPVGNTAIQEVFAAKAYYQCDGAWVVTNNTFTEGAIEQAGPCGVKLVDGDDLARMQTRASTRTWLPAVLTLAAVAAITVLLVAADSGTLNFLR